MSNIVSLEKSPSFTDETAKITAHSKEIERSIQQVSKFDEFQQWLSEDFNIDWKKCLVGTNLGFASRRTPEQGGDWNRTAQLFQGFIAYISTYPIFMSKDSEPFLNLLGKAASDILGQPTEINTKKNKKRRDNPFLKRFSHLKSGKTTLSKADGEMESPIISFYASRKKPMATSISISTMPLKEVGISRAGLKLRKKRAAFPTSYLETSPPISFSSRAPRNLLCYLKNCLPFSISSTKATG